MRCRKASVGHELPSELTLFDLASGTPLLWDEQRAQIGMVSDYGTLD